MPKYLLSDADLQPLHSLVLYADGRIWPNEAAPIPQSDYNALVRAAATMLRNLTPMPAAASSLASNNLAGLQRIASAIRNARKAQRLSQSDVASKIGLHQSVISHIEKGTRALNQQHLEAIGRFLGIELEAAPVDDYAGMP